MNGPVLFWSLVSLGLFLRSAAEVPTSDSASVLVLIPAAFAAFVASICWTYDPSK